MPPATIRKRTQQRSHLEEEEGSDGGSSSAKDHSNSRGDEHDKSR